MNKDNAYTAMITTGGTGGHIFPGIAVAKQLAAEGWNVFWLGTKDGLESRLVPEAGIDFESVSFRGVRGKGIKTLLLGPFMLLRALGISLRIIKRRKPDLVIGFGGFASFPGALAGVAKRIPLVLHESNAVPGLANKILRHGADRILVGFPGVFEEGRSAHVIWTGNPVRQSLLEQAKPEERFAQRSADAPLRVLVVGGSLGAKVINETVPRALALLPADKRPVVTHQAGVKHIDSLRAEYEKVGVNAACIAFINEMAEAYAAADLVICRGGAMTVSELAAVGVGALIVPFAGAIANEQDANAEQLVQIGGAVKMKQEEFTPEALAKYLSSVTHQQLAEMAKAAYALRRDDTNEQIVRVCTALVDANWREKRI